ncbi:MAG: glycosyltransferase family 2 protein [Chloroflexota bacterium]
MSDPAPPAARAPSAPPTAPRVTVSLVTWNGLRWLPGCLEALAAQDLDGGLAAIELLVTDNGSADGSAAWLADELPRRFPAATLIRESRNLGYAPAHDRHILAARGDAVLLLNQDLELDPGFLRAALAVLDADPRVAAVQGRIGRLAGPGARLATLDTTGLVMARDRRVVSRGQGEPDGPDHARPGPVWGVDGPAPVYRRSALSAVRLPSREGGLEVLDRDFFAYKEDVDLSWRLGRLGWRAWYAPDARAWHGRGASASISAGGAGIDLGSLRQARAAVPGPVKARSWGNQRLMQLKNDPLEAVLRDLLPIVRREAGSLAFAIVADRAVLRGIPRMLRGVPWALRKRRALDRLVRSGRARPPA